MTDCFDLLPEWTKEKLSISSKHQEWKRCASCYIYSTSAKLKVCAGCSHRSQPVFYCSKECQKTHWPRHRDDCRMKTPALCGMDIPDKDPEDQRLEKIIERWRFAHYQILVFCIMNIYHFNPELDPARHFIVFELDPKTMQIVFSLVQSMERYADYFNRPAIQAVIKPGSIFYMMYVLTSTPSASIHQEVLSSMVSLEARSKIKGYPQWPWIAAHLTRRWQPSAEIAWRMKGLFLNAIDLNKEIGVPFDEFSCERLYPSQGIRMTAAIMAQWYAKLASLDFWRPSVVTGCMDLILDAEYKDANAVPRALSKDSGGSVSINT